nr:septin and tuftelin-interacting protein 1 homolog 1-like [Aegilops tauschii subsp. strangulata]
MASAGADESSNVMTSGGSTYRHDDRTGSESGGAGSRPSPQHKSPRGPGDLLFGRVPFVAAGSAGPSSPQHHHQRYTRQHYNPATTWKPQPVVESPVFKNTTVVNMMRRMNYEVGSGSGLGKHGQGITSPVKVVKRPESAGFGTVGAEGEGSYDNGLPNKVPETLPTKWGADQCADEISQAVYNDWEMGDADGSRQQGREFCEKILAEVRELQDGVLDDGEHMVVDAAEEIIEVVTLVHQKSESGELTAGHLILVFTRLKEKFPEEYQTYCLANTAGVLVARLIGPVLQRWQPLWDPAMWLDVFVVLRNTLDDGSAMSPYVELVEDTVVPAVQALEWKTTDSERMRRFLAQWKDTLPPSAVQRILVEVVMPELTAEVESWDPRDAWQADCCHLLLRQWMPLAGPLLESLCVTVRRKLERALREWDDAGHALLSKSNLNLVAPWKALFGRASWEEFVDGIGVVRHLEQRLRSLRITPPKQNDDAFLEVIMKWAPLVRAEDMARLLEAEFFGRWRHALRHWLLAAKPATREAVEWCNGWGRAFTPELREDERVHARLEAGIDMVNSAAQGLEI